MKALPSDGGRQLTISDGRVIPGTSRWSERSADRTCEGLGKIEADFLGFMEQPRS